MRSSVYGNNLWQRICSRQRGQGKCGGHTKSDVLHHSSPMEEGAQFQMKSISEIMHEPGYN